MNSITYSSARASLASVMDHVCNYHGPPILDIGQTVHPKRFRNLNLNNKYKAYAMSDKKILPAFLLAFFFGVFGAHRFYSNRYAIAIIQLLTFGGLGIWAMIDCILIVFGESKDGKGSKITEWT
jgi:TM2 domain-containing membrane protein YozV